MYVPATLAQPATALSALVIDASATPPLQAPARTSLSELRAELNVLEGHTTSVTGKLLGEVTGTNGAHGTAIAQASGHGFATSGNDQSVVMFDLKTFKTLGRIPSAEDTDAIVYERIADAWVPLQSFPAGDTNPPG